MNREKKEELRKYKEARKGLSPKEIEELDQREERQKKICALANKLHGEMFSEEYDYIYDDFVGVNTRRQGRNPMSSDYIERVQKRRKEMGIAPLGEDGMPVSDDSMRLCWKLAKEQLGGAE